MPAAATAMESYAPAWKINASTPARRFPQYGLPLT